MQWVSLQILLDGLWSAYRFITHKHLVYHAFRIATCLSSLEAGRLHDTLLHISCISTILNIHTLTGQSAVFSPNRLPAMMCPLVYYASVITNRTRCCTVKLSALGVLAIRMVARAMAWVCGSSRAGTAGSDPAEVMISVFCKCCVLSDRGLCVGRLLVQKISTECDVSECNHEASILRTWQSRGCFIKEKLHSFMLSVP